MKGYCVVIKSCVVTLETKMEKGLKVKQSGQRNEKNTGLFLQSNSTELV